MQLARRPINRSTVIGAVLLALALLLDIIATNRLAIALGPASDLFPRWVGARAWVIDNVDPYSPDVTSTVRSAMGDALGWDGTADSGTFAFGFVYPGYVALLLAPLAILPFPAASTIWLLISQASVVGTVWLVWHTPSHMHHPNPTPPDANALRYPNPAPPDANALRYLNPPHPDAPAPRLYDASRGLFITTVLALFSPPVIYNLIFGQFAVLATLAIATAGWATARRHDRFAGTILPLALVKPQLALIPVTLWVAGQVTHWFRPATAIDLPSAGRTQVGGEARESPPDVRALPLPGRMSLPISLHPRRHGWGNDTGNWHGIAAFTVTVATVGAASLIALPHWPGAFLDGLNGYAVTARATTTVGIIASVITIEPSANMFIQAVLIGAVLATVFLAPSGRNRTGHSLLPAGVLTGAWIIPPVYEWNHVVGLLILVPLIRNRLDAPARADRTGGLRVDGLPAAVHPTPAPLPLMQRPFAIPARPRLMYVRFASRAQWEGVLHAAATWRWAPAIAWGITNIATLPLAVLWPDGSRAVWPVILLGAWVVDHRTRPRAPLASRNGNHALGVAGFPHR